MKNDLLSTEEVLNYLRVPFYTFNIYKKKHKIEVAKKEGHYNFFLKSDIDRLKVLIDSVITDKQKWRYEKAAQVSIEKLPNEVVKSVRERVGNKIREDIESVNLTANKASIKAGIHYAQVLRMLEGKDVQIYTWVLIAKVLGKPLGLYLDMFIQGIRDAEGGHEIV